MTSPLPPGRLRLRSDVSVELSGPPPGRMRSVSEATRAILENTFRDNIPSGQIRSPPGAKELATQESPPGNVRKPSDTLTMYMTNTNDLRPVEHPEIFHEKNLPPGIPFSKRAEAAIANWAQSSGTRVENLKQRARQRPDGSLDISDPESDFSDLPPAPLIVHVSNDGKREKVSAEKEPEEEVELLEGDDSAECLSLFNEFDMNGDGFINVSELREGLRKRGIVENISVEKMIRDADVDGNARIDVEEFRKVLSLHEDDAKLKKREKNSKLCASVISNPAHRYEKNRRRFSAASMMSALSLEEAPSRHNSIAIREEPQTIEIPGSVKIRSLKKKREEKITVPSPSVMNPTQFSQDVNREVSAILGQDELERSMMINNISIRESAKPFMKETRHFFYIVKRLSDRAGISEACRVMRGYYRHLVHDEPTKRCLRAFLTWLDEFEMVFGLAVGSSLHTQ